MTEEPSLNWTFECLVVELVERWKALTDTEPEALVNIDFMINLIDQKLDEMIGD